MLLLVSASALRRLSIRVLCRCRLLALNLLLARRLLRRLLFLQLGFLGQFQSCISCYTRTPDAYITKSLILGFLYVFDDGCCHPVSAAFEDNRYLHTGHTGSLRVRGVSHCYLDGVY